MASSTPSRPTAVTVFGWLIVLGSIFLVITAFEQVSALRSLDNRRRVQEFLGEPPGDGLGIGLETTLELLHVLGVVTGGCAAGAAVLGVYVLRRNRHARTALTVLVVPLFLAGVALGGLLPALVAVGTVALWMQPARAWFDGVEPPRPSPGSPFGGSKKDVDASEDQNHHADQNPDADQNHHDDEQVSRRERQPVQQGAGVGPGVGSGVGPGVGSGVGSGVGTEDETARVEAPLGEPVAGGGARAYVGFGGPGSAPAEGAAASADASHAAAPVRGAASRPARPRAVLLACVVTWASCAMVGTLMLGTVAALTATPDMLLDEVRRQNPELGGQVSRSMLMTATVGMGLAVLVWCAAASAVAFFVLRGRRWARIALAVSATVVATGAAVLSASSVALLVPAFAGGVTAYWLLFRPEVRSWFSRA